MQYTYEILSLIGWPILIYVTYLISMKLINKFEENMKKQEKKEE